MLKPLQTDYKGHSITLECTYKKVWPPPQMYGHTPNDIDVMWKQGTIDAALHQQLATWKDKCGLMVMGPRCLDCPLAKIQKPRPGRPHVIETSPWLERKEQMHWEDMKRSSEAIKEVQTEEEGFPEDEGDETLVDEDLGNEIAAELAKKEEPKTVSPKPKKDVADEMVEKGILDSEPEASPSTKPDKKPLADDDDDVIAALAED